jgi:hypothetical protein
LPVQSGVTQFALDYKALNKLGAMMENGSVFRNKIGANWQIHLEEIILANKTVPCHSCGNLGQVGRTQMDELLHNIEHLVDNFNVGASGKGEKLYNWIRNKAINGGTPTSGQMDEVHQTLEVIRREGLNTNNVVDFGKSFPIGDKLYDIRKVGDKFHELKNKDFTVSGVTDDVDQMIDGYFKNIKSFDDFIWEAKFSKLQSKWTTIADAETQLKSKWKAVFEGAKKDAAFDALWNNTVFKGNSFSGLTKNQAKAVFENWVSTTDPAMFKFIKVQ